jgi:signal transduction histidine kinase
VSAAPPTSGPSSPEAASPGGAAAEPAASAATAPGPPRPPASESAGIPEPSAATSLRRRVYLLMAIGTFVPVLVLGTVVFTWMSAFDQRLVAARLAAADAVAAHLDAELTLDLEVLQRLAGAAAQGLDDGDPGPERRLLREALPHFRHREAVFLLDGAHAVVAEEPQGRFSQAPRAAIPLVDEVLASGRPRLSGLVFGDRGGIVHELVPIRSWRGDVVGVAGGTFRPERRDFDKMLRYLRRGQSGFAEVVDSEGRIIASTESGRVGRLSECSRRFGLLAAEKRTLSARCADCHADEGVPLRPKEHLTLAAIGAAPWAIVVRQDAAEALPLQGMLPWYAGLGLLVVQLALAGAFGWGAARSVTHPVGVLTEHAERIAGGELAWPIPDLGGDEVGRLGRSLEHMRQNLGTLIARVAEANASLEQRVADRTKELNEANAQLTEREEARSQLLRKVITAQEDERKRIARELHDETSQALAVLAMGIEAAQDALRGGKTPRLDEVKAVAVRTLEDVHRLILDLRPSVLDDLGLLSAIQWYADRQLSTRGISVRCEFGELPRLPPEMETALFRVCQETMSNVARHAQASAALVQVGVEEGEVVIDIEDDGKGFDAAAVALREGRRSWGLLGIRERAEILGGTARIESAPGQGTHVEVRIPLPAAPPPPAGGAGEGMQGGGTPPGLAVPEGGAA